MYDERTSIWKTVDWFTIILYVLMITAGWFCICGASYEYDSASFFDPQGRPGSQMLWIGSSFILVFVILMLEKSFFDIYAYIIYAIIFLLLIATIFLAKDIKGSYSWLVIGPIHIQPAEFAKFATALALAKLMNTYGFALNTAKNFAIALGIIFLPMVCILLQKETGSALVFLAFFLVLYREGMSGYILLAGICAIIFFITELKFADIIIGITPMGKLIVSSLILSITAILVLNTRKDRQATWIILGVSTAILLIGFAISFFYPLNFLWITIGLIIGTIVYLLYLSIKNWMYHYALIALFAIVSVGFLYSVDYVFSDLLEPHQQIRIKVSLGLEDDPSGAGYNVNQSKIAIGSGGIFGKGFLNGTQTKLKYVPEQDTDFIFCTIGEEFGFVGSSAILILYTIFIVRLFILSERQENAFGRVYGYSVASIFLFHLIINVGMVMGISPVIGIPLPFFSYGGSSLWGFTILLFVFLRIDALRRER